MSYNRLGKGYFKGKIITLDKVLGFGASFKVGLL
jgi:hypothetical protein